MEDVSATPSEYSYNDGVESKEIPEPGSNENIKVEDQLGLVDFDEFIEKYETADKVENPMHFENLDGSQPGEDLNPPDDSDKSNYEHGEQLTSKENNTTDVSPANQDDQMNYNRESKIDEDATQIYNDAGVETEKPEKETLCEKEYDVYKNKDIDPDLRAPDGSTNRERMERGEAPYILRDGKLEKVELHHHNQQDGGPLVELPRDAHHNHNKELHPKNGKGEGRGPDPQWGKRVGEHWKQRAGDY
jgi:hypothetical protein